MKKALLMAVAAAFLATSAFAQVQAEKPAKAQTPAKKIEKAALRKVTVTGVVLNADAKSLRMGNFKDHNFVLNADTKIKRGSRTITAADLKGKEKVTVTYTEVGNTMTATTITVEPEKK